MSKMKELVIDIEELLTTELTYEEIAKKLFVPVDWVIEVAKGMENSYDDSMDGDAASALASVGWGTDEDYGYSGDDD